MGLPGAILGVVGSILGQQGQRRQERRNIRDQTAANKELAEYAYGKDLEQWERQNLYNQPSAQMARLREAGLNPNLVYGSGSAAGVTSPAKSPQYQTVRADFSKRQSPLGALDMLGMYQEFKMKNAQIDLVRANADVGKQQRDFMIGKTPETITGPSGKRRIEMTPSGMQLRKYQLQIKQQQARGYEMGADLKAIELEWLEIMKKMGIGKAFLIPMMRMFMGR